ncbi:Shg1p ASCRUDRAFT_70548 [Ascoidea rubescens DSM 1968]|uniref:BOD1/SHG1 domain-containing protein n=1 Tax=Ascoidea rubescens DSM 1968 TaxID=1344418 RepID=A0A1D2VG68_9ASCO|nr:hypothetical protein ASCRUDRAFT_70548 [Ascoidea rubescens DSM 1968]ODV60661.1 hypothetical protein ASCRUDRAFT_70548 [Ascoidea rubescens DSM 1968]
MAGLNGNTSNAGSKAIDINKLILTYKRSGSFDERKKEILQSFVETPQYQQLMQLVRKFVDNEISKDPSLLFKNRGQLTALIEGSIMRLPDSVGKSNVDNKGENAGQEQDISPEDIFESFDEFEDNAQISSVISKMIDNLANESTVNSNRLRNEVKKSLNDMVDKEQNR